MKRVGYFRRVAATLAFAGMFVSQLAQAATPAAPRPATPGGVAIRDVAMHEGGTVRGQVVDTLGTPQANTKVAIVRQGELVSTTTTDGAGRFEVAGLSGGVYQIITAQNGSAFRLWTTNTAPPAAQGEVLLISGNDVVRGIGPNDGGVLSWLGNPWVLAGLVAAAIVIPLSLDHKSGS